MYARVLAPFAIIVVSVTTLQAASITPVGVYLRSGPSFSPVILREMKLELDSLMHNVDVPIEWWNPQQHSTIDSKIVIVDLRGNCEPPAANAGAMTNLTSLASTAVADGHILPFSSVDCASVNSFLADSLVAMPSLQREHVYAKALARLIAHEIYHILTQSVAHESGGIAKARVSALDLIREHFEFAGGRTRTVDQAVPAAFSSADVGGGK